jgi:catechol-2,3-dioxygenase
MKLRTLDYVVLLCENLERMEAFYHETLGFSIERNWEDWIELRAGAVLLTLRRRRRPAGIPCRARRGVRLS